MSYERINGLTVSPTSLHEYVVDHDHTEVKPRLGRPPSINHFRYTVIGKGPFPFDMLRFDGAFPASTDDALKLCLGSDATREERATTREITLRVTTNNALFLPCFDRWRSFGWVVKSTAHD